MTWAKFLNSFVCIILVGLLKHLHIYAHFLLNKFHPTFNSTSGCLCETHLRSMGGCEHTGVTSGFITLCQAPPVVGVGEGRSHVLP